MKIPARWRVAIIAALVLSLLNSAAVNRQQEGQEKRLADVEAKVKKIEDYLYHTVAPLVNKGDGGVEEKVKKMEDYLYHEVAPLVNEREKRK